MVLIKRCNCYLSSDTGPLHMAKALGTPFIGLYGQTSAAELLLKKTRGKSLAIFQSDLLCSPCERHSDLFPECLNLGCAYCMQDISQEQILAEINRLVANSKGVSL